MDEYHGGRPDDLVSDEPRPATAAGSQDEESARQQLRAEIEEIQHRLEQKVDKTRDAVKQTAEADRQEIEEARAKLDKIRGTVKDGWENVTEKSAAALLKLIK